MSYTRNAMFFGTTWACCKTNQGNDRELSYLHHCFQKHSFENKKKGFKDCTQRARIVQRPRFRAFFFASLSAKSLTPFLNVQKARCASFRIKPFPITPH